MIEIGAAAQTGVCAAHTRMRQESSTLPPSHHTPCQPRLGRRGARIYSAGNAPSPARHSRAAACARRAGGGPEGPQRGNAPVTLAEKRGFAGGVDPRAPLHRPPSSVWHPRVGRCRAAGGGGGAHARAAAQPPLGPLSKAGTPARGSATWSPRPRGACPAPPPYAASGAGPSSGGVAAL